jgi:L-rhamnose-H+ transport protein
MSNALLGVVFHGVGGLSSASFYVPYKSVRHWSWGVFWLVGGVVSWIIAPWLFAALLTHDLLGVLVRTPPKTLFLCWLFGALWGFGGLTFGLTMRHLGISLGTALVIGVTSAFGTVIPPLVDGEFGMLLGTRSGQTMLFGVLVSLLGIVILGLAGKRKEEDQRGSSEKGLAEPVSFGHGVMVAVFSGVMSSCLAYGIAAGGPIRQLTLAAGTPILSQGLPVLCVALAGAFTTNALWCLFLILKERTGRQFLGKGCRSYSVPLLSNYLFCALGGTVWYLQLLFYTMGQSQMGRLAFASWPLQMSSIIIFATLWGLALKEWKGASTASRSLLAIGLTILVGSTIVIGLGSAMATHE